ncbi:ABC transporter permease [Liquorilactobacillus mali]|uniref:ABC transporter permease n=1 Tax=Liquorilactobacillus mali TaxID=1618 RepID=UPI002350C4BA|nr:ABC transporter permease [Liquorilactobacillus mali]MDC7953443.1 ABC transporter permease [Liquorilactobacillus mali]MDV7757817.1 ABC transporter permease [Liquorilactobacillus mali]
MMTKKEISVTNYFFKNTLRKLGYMLVWLVFSSLFFPWVFNGFEVENLSVNSALKNTEVGPILAILISGIALFSYNDFKLLIQNGISRKTFWKARILSFLAISILGQLIAIVVALLNPYTHHSWQGNSLYMQVYGKYFGSTAMNSFMGLCFILISTSVVMLGAIMVGSIFSLFTKKAKVYIFIGLFVMGVVFINWISMATQNDHMRNAIKNADSFLHFIIGYGGANIQVGKWNPAMPFVVAILTGVVCLLGSYAVMKRFKIKNE